MCAGLMWEIAVLSKGLRWKGAWVLGGWAGEGVEDLGGGLVCLNTLARSEN